MKTENEIIQNIMEYAGSDDNVRAVIRTELMPVREYLYSYQFYFIVHDIEKYEDDVFENCFGERILLFRGDKNYPDMFQSIKAHLMVYRDGITLVIKAMDIGTFLRKYNGEEIHDNVWIGDTYKKIMDKDGILPDIERLEEMQTIFAEVPTKEEFEGICNEFWWVLKTFAEYTLRKELPAAMFYLNTAVRDLLNRMLRWFIYLSNGKPVDPGILDCNLEKLLEKKLFSLYKKTYPDADYEHIRQAYDAVTELWSYTGKAVAENMGFSYPEEDEKNMLEFIHKLRETEPLSVIRLFISEPVKEYSTKDSSHGDDDFREAIFVTTESGIRFVVKVACNSFTTAESIRMWQRCAGEYLKHGYYCPQIFASVDGQFPVVNYKGHECVAYAEEYSVYGSAENSAGAKSYRDDLYIMTAKIAAQKYDYTSIPSAYTLFDLFPGDETDEVTDNAIDFLEYCKTLPENFAKQADRMFRRWKENRKELEALYHKLPFSVFQADFNDTNVLLDKEGSFVGICDFNLAGRDEFLNYLFREIIQGSLEEELAEIMRALKISSVCYNFSEDEIKAAPLIYRCVKPLWYTRVYALKEAGDDPDVIQACLDEMEYAQTREIDFRSVMV